MRAPRHVLLLLLVALLAPACAPTPPQPRRTFSVQDALAAAPVAGFERALEVRPFAFPADHGPHLGFRTEWWYFTGNLEDADGARLGFQLTFFRDALAPRAPSPSAWATNEIWMAHLALTDVEAGRFHAFERFERGALDLAGARATPFAVWTGPWRAESSGTSTFPLRLRAEQDGMALDLELSTDLPPVLEGDRGLSRKGAEPGNASYYYSCPRLATRGTVRVEGEARSVHGSSWLDREWSTSALEPDQVGWDWFALQLAGGRALMLYRLRRADGTASPQSAGTLIAADGTPRPLALEDFTLEALDNWQSPASGVVYPSRWRVRVPAGGLDFEVRPVLDDQELDLAFRYWEGAVNVSGSAEGRGYVELTGYDAPAR